MTGRKDAPALYAVGEEACVRPPNVLVEAEPYPLPSIGVVLSGFLDYRGEQGPTTAVPGTVLFGNPGEEFFFQYRDARGEKSPVLVRRLVVVFSRSFLEEVAQECELKGSQFRAVALSPSVRSATMFGQMRKLALQIGDNDETAYTLAAAALRVDSVDSKPISLKPRNRRRIPSVVRYIEETYNGDCSLKILAEIACLSPFHFLRVFKDATGLSPNQYVINTRLRAAADCLLGARQPISEVALAVGFRDLSHFNLCFRGLFGCSPRQWRRGG